MEICRIGDPGEPTTGSPRIGIADEERALLFNLVKGCTYVLEIGTGIGNSTRAMADAVPYLTTVDIDPWVHRTIWPELAREFHNIEFRTGWPDVGPVWDAIFIDANHQTPAVEQDIDDALARLAPDGIIIFHDVNYPNVMRAIDNRLQGSRLEIHHTEHGIGVYHHVHSDE